MFLFTSSCAVTLGCIPAAAGSIDSQVVRPGQFFCLWWRQKRGGFSGATMVLLTDTL